MKQTKIDFYTESGIAKPLNITLVFLCGLISILFFSYFYSLIITYLPIIYFNFLIVIGFGFTIAFLSRIFNVVFKIRNRRKSIIITIILSLFAIYFQWVSYIFIISFDDYDFFKTFKEFEYFLSILFRPDIVIENIIEISKVGLWSIGSSNLYIRGFMLWAIWLVEACIIIFVSYNIFKNFNDIPFSEKDNKWFKKEIIDFDFEHIAFKKKFVEEFLLNPFESVNQLKRGDGLRHSKISIFKSETESKNLITIDNVIVTQRGKGKKDYTKVLEYCYVDNSDLSQIKGKFRTKKASIFDY
ncbi:hypothetical protein [Mariniflexile sp. HMF6888]|uniref:hypothetical protein n=1 Tax=Mariniflexile sp. HMF6888 TaxID=3373086 RepID=UPI0037B672CF